MLSDQLTNGTPTTTTPFESPILTLKNNITIRAYHSTDTHPLAHHANNRKLWLNLQNRFPHPYKPENAHNWFSSQTPLPTHAPNPPVPSNYIICHNNIPIGAIGLEKDEGQPHVASLGYWLGEEYWGRGIATEAAGAFLRWSFETFPWLVKVAADAYSWNEASQRVLMKIGMKKEGTLRMAICKAGRYGDLVLFGIVRDGFIESLVQGESKKLPEAEAA